MPTWPSWSPGGLEAYRRQVDYVPVLLSSIFKLTNNRSPADYLRGIKNKPEFMELERQRKSAAHW